MKQRASSEEPVRITTVLLAVLAFILALAAWELAARERSGAFLPSPTRILMRLAALLSSGVLPQHILASLGRLVLGYLAALVLGLLVGASAGANLVIRTAAQSVLSVLVSVPTIAWVPVMLVALGLGDATIVASVFIGAFFPVAYGTVRGLELVDPCIVRSARTMGLSGLPLFLKVRFPAALVSILNGARIAFTYGWRALIGAEMLAALAGRGLGLMIFQARFWNDTATMIAGLIMIGTAASIIDHALLRFIERRTISRWGMLGNGNVQ